MLFSTANQAQVFIWMMAAGVFIGLVCSLFALLRRVLRPALPVLLVLDLLLGACCGALFALALVLGNYGRLRLFEILAAALGALLFGSGFRPLLRALLLFLRKNTFRIKASLSKNRLIKALFR